MPQVNITDVIDRSRVGVFQCTIFILCGLCLITDGFDVQAMGYIAPALVRDWHIPNSALGPVFSAAIAGVLFGSLIFSVLADKIGRRPVLIMCSLYFAVFTLLTARTNSIGPLLAIRFIGGFGMGGIMPNAMALVGEYSPKKIRITAMMVVSCGFTVGAAIGGFIAAWLIPAFGWRSVFYFGGAVPLVIAVLMIFLLPESLQFMALRGRDQEKLARSLRRIDPSIAAGTSAAFVVTEEKKAGMPFIHLFREGRTTVTVLLWIVNFMNLVNLYFLSSWVPTVVRDTGYSTAIAVLVGTAVQVGGTAGAFGNSWFIGRIGFTRALTPIFAVGAISIAFIGQPFLTLTILFAAVFIAGWCVVGGQPAVNALAAVYYPTYLRSTGIGWSLGIGRIGAIVGPLVGGELMALKWAPREVFYAAAIPAAISAGVMLVLNASIKKPAGTDAKAAELLVH